MNHSVNFFIVGEPKSGTTALAKFLGEHPDVGIANPKEPHYFATDLQRESDDFHGAKNHHFAIRTAEQYAQCFAKVADQPILGEGSTHYLCSTEAAGNIKTHNPDAKIIIMLRNPVSFLHSLHMQYINNGSENEPDFGRALALEADRRVGKNIPQGVRCPSHLFYSERIQYATHIQRFLDVFPRDQVKIILMEEFNQDNETVYRDTLRFLGLETPGEMPDFGVVHGSKAPRSPRLHRFLNHPSLKYTVLKIVGANRYDAVKDRMARLTLKQQKRSTLDPALREQLKNQSIDEVKKVATLINRPDLLSLWGYQD